ncbi:4-hydroxy-tetrahydrodipicolinate reductase [Kiritimatiella glycovorans]|uniref:4-hydroxy-tetrahydrodipicolinate reductase n=1 Tax=Kiritimatiella glycovorans TaxID=1307763 RepID=A0A0G3EBN4_9BACT|nr:4-hydroxy-tetrahydrodipicolinate reductase [Kiritimatiella glycovorans]AKJ63723.1 4-hydroxy-tetrahydrodipicolinate reductase [Kiritimatiella glycovorans]
MGSEQQSIKRVVVLGAAGRMGRAIIRSLVEEKVPGLELAGAVDLWDASGLGEDAGVVSGTRAAGVSMGSDLAAVTPDAEVVIDFSSHVATSGNAERIAEWGCGWVIGTTGLNDEEMDAVRAAAHKVPVVMAGNMSLGINLLCTLIEAGAKALRGRGYDVEVVERHHRRKKDAPSGTALMLARSAAEGCGWDLDQVRRDGRSGHTGERPDKEIGIHAVRGGGIVGEHTLTFAGEGEVLEFTHRALSRETFALGALQAAKWLEGRDPGLYSMRDVLGV